jgi:hypothetical protein
MKLICTILLFITTLLSLVTATPAAEIWDMEPRIYIDSSFNSTHSDASTADAPILNQYRSLDW